MFVHKVMKLNVKGTCQLASTGSCPTTFQDKSMKPQVRILNPMDGKKWTNYVKSWSYCLQFPPFGGRGAELGMWSIQWNFVFATINRGNCHCHCICFATHAHAWCSHWSLLETVIKKTYPWHIKKNYPLSLLLH